MELRTTHDGMLRAFGLLLSQGARKQVASKFVYRPFGSAIHASRRLRKHEADAVNAITDQLKLLDPRDDANTEAVEKLLKELAKRPVKFVPLKLEQRIDRSKSYPYRSTKRGG